MQARQNAPGREDERRRARAYVRLIEMRAMLVSLGVLCLAGCTDDAARWAFAHDGVAVVVQGRGDGLRATVFQAGADAPTPFARAHLEDGALALRIGDDDVTRGQVPAALHTAALMGPLVYAAARLRAACLQEPGCERGDGDGGAVEATGFAPFGQDRALALLAGWQRPRDAQARADCRELPRVQGDQICTGWVGVAFTPAKGVQDVSYCCAEHDACFYSCPLGEDGACRGTACIQRCNARIRPCCTEAGGDLLTCTTWAVATQFGGGGTNGCGTGRLQEHCDERDFSTCEDDDRCVCEACNEMLGRDEDCSACTCADECDLNGPATCGSDGRGHFVLRCENAAYAGCAKWQENFCDPGERCVYVDGEPACRAQDCALSECEAAGETTGGCRADEGGAYYQLCAYDTLGCLAWHRVYCDEADGSGGACVVGADGPSCAAASPPG